MNALRSLVLLGIVLGTILKPAMAKEKVILLHGLARTSWSMRAMARAAEKAGFQAISIRYPSRHHSVENLAEFVESRIQEMTSPGEALHFITHSLGGIIVRVLDSRRDRLAFKIDRVVMLAPPNQGSEIVDRLGHWALFRLINGPAGAQLGTKEGSLPRLLGPPHFECAVVAGRRRLKGPLSWLLPGEDDGKVTIASTKLAGIKAHHIITASHTFILSNRNATHLAVDFLRGEQPPAAKTGTL